MDEKKHIDRLFQEKLKDFEVFPAANVWKNIEDELVKKKRRRIVPLWLRLGSAAAVLLLMVSTGFWFFNEVPANNDSPLTEPNTFEPKTADPDVSNKDIITKTPVSGGAPNEAAPTKAPDPISVKTNKNQISQRPENENLIAAQEKAQVSETASENAVVERSSTSNEPVDSKNKSLDNVQQVDQALDEQVAENNQNAQKDFEITKEDIANAIEEQLNDQIDTNPLNRWSVGTAVAPVYFNTLNEGSPINSSLAGNTKEGNTSLSYGVKVNYQINDRFSIQSGVNNVELGYDTQGVTALIASSELRLFDTNIDTNIDGVNLIAISNNEVAAQSSELGIQRGVVNLRGDLNQSLSYIEIPLEAKYAVINKKVGLHLVGGVSTYVLYQNKIALFDQNGSTTLGEASNVNDVNFSGNLGIDLDYKINKKIFINVTPMFKYQMNTFSKNDGGFRPYYLGVYTGLNFRF